MRSFKRRGFFRPALLLVAVSAVGCAANQAAVTTVENPAAAPAETPADFVRRYQTYNWRGQWGSLWDQLHPHDQQLMPRSRFIECELRDHANDNHALESISVRSTYETPIAISGIDSQTAMKATYVVTYSVEGQREMKTFISSPFIKVRGKWRFVFKPERRQAVIAGQCPGGAPATAPSETPPLIQVESEGWLQRPNAAGVGDFIHYGLVLRNKGALDARNVRVSVNFLSASRELLTTEDWVITSIPAGRRFFYGNATLDVPRGKTVSRMKSTVSAEAAAPASTPQFRFSNVRPYRDASGFFVRGEVENISDTDASNVRLYYVVRDSNGEVLAGGVDSTSDINLPVGSRKAFSEYVSSSPPPRAASAAASADVCCG